MRLNKEELKKISEKPNRELWETIKEMGRGHGLNLPDTMPSPENLEKIRRVLSGTEKINLSEATKIINSYKNKRS
jgi:hypothetical protein